MKPQTRNLLWLCLLLCLSLGALSYLLNTLSISYNEAKEFFNPRSFGGFAGYFSTQIFGQNDWGLRVPFLLLHLLNAFLMFFFAQGFLKRPSDALMCAFLFLLIPGVNAAALLVSNSGIVIALSLILCIWVQKRSKIPYLLLLVMAFADESFALVFVALIFYGMERKQTFLILVSLGLFALNMYCFGLEVGGHPSGYFLDSNGHLLLIFSPLLFLYFLYTLYRYFNTNKKPLAWYITSTTLGFIWLLSMRQRVQTESFAPLLILALPLMVNLYFSGLRVRLPQFRARYTIPFLATFLILLSCNGILFLSKPLFVLFPQANEHFAFRHFIAKELALSLKAKGIDKVQTTERLQERLRFYGISKGTPLLTSNPLPNASKIPILYYDKPIMAFYLQDSKLH
ncbi:hypothetical protein [Helicobacter sp. MIT 05-5294]|uniref:hypothetical protein n=1 Tax=Helicobacter sp. MIT 05-5294 TaxID=1548150 RepID=UPI00051FC18F|nr:hypothetical protein [Helicobacter sp. MIT 05-5294]TLD89073.1 hypothetical protein LS69_000055 [Helicobacter sp. MIT 05-5294]